jgi:hypothetical protein
VTWGRAARYIALLAAAFVGYVILVGGDFIGPRFLFHVFPFIVVLSVAAVRSLLTTLLSALSTHWAGGSRLSSLPFRAGRQAGKPATTLLSPSADYRLGKPTRAVRVQRIGLNGVGARIVLRIQRSRLPSFSDSARTCCHSGSLRKALHFGS